MEPDWKFLLPRLWTQVQVQQATIAALIATHPDKSALVEELRRAFAQHQARDETNRVTHGKSVVMPQFFADLSEAMVAIAQVP
jgi:hypothetical protein